MTAISVLLVLLCADCRAAGDSAREPLTVTYVGNTGYLVSCNGHKVAVDALFGGKPSPYYEMPSDSLVNLMVAAKAPFDSIDIIAVTHRHADHFDASIVARHMKANSRAILVCSPQTAERMAKQPEYAEIRDRILIATAPLDSATAFDRNDVIVKALTSKHGSYFDTDSTGKSVDIHRNTEHREYLITIGERSFLHVGDAPIQYIYQFVPLGLGKDSIDAAFVQRWNCNDRASFDEKLIRDRALPRRIFFTHMAPGEGAKLAKRTDCENYRNVIIPTRSLETWLVR